MRRGTGFAAVLCLIAPWNALAQRAVDPGNQGERIYAIVPMVGTGRGDDPRRPLFAPLRTPGARTTPADPVITGFRYELSANGQLALVEFIAGHPKAFDAIRGANRADVKVFERNRATVADLEREFRAHKPNFDGQKFLGGGR